MCLYPRLIKNRKYVSNKKNGGNIPPITDERVKYVPIGCQKCIECKKKKARDWKVRLTEDIKHNKHAKFITLTFSDESINKLICENEELQELNGYPLDNGIATKAVRLFNERWRKKYKKALRHWLVTELGHNGTENIHLHGIIYTQEDFSTIAKLWQYGYIWPNPERKNTRNYVNGKTISYLTKYVLKNDKDHPNYNSKILTSPGIGCNYTETYNFTTNKFKGEETDEAYRQPNGTKISLPIYYRNKVYSEQEREKLWLQRLDKNERYIMGVKLKADDDNAYYSLLKYYRDKNREWGFGDDTKDYDQQAYETQRRIILNAKRLQRAKDKQHDYTKIRGHDKDPDSWEPCAIQF